MGTSKILSSGSVVIRLLAFALVVTSFPVEGFSQSSHNNLVTVFGPERYFSGPKEVRLFRESFGVPTAPSQGQLILINGNGEDIAFENCRNLRGWDRFGCNWRNLAKRFRLRLERPRAVEIALNGSVILRPSDLDPTLGRLVVPVNLESSNELKIKLRGFPLSSISIEVRGRDEVPPVITLSSPQPGQIIDAWEADIEGTANEALSSVVAQLNSEPPVNLSVNGDSFSGTITTTSNGLKTLTVTARDIAGNESTITRSITMRINHPPIAELSISSPSSGLAPLMVMFNASNSVDQDGDPLTYVFDWGDGEVTSTGHAKVSHEFKHPGTYRVRLTVEDPLGLTSTDEVTVTATMPELPPTPAEVAPPLAQDKQTPFDEAVSFLYQGANPIQLGADTNAFVDDRVSVVNGVILDGDGNPLPGVKISVLGRPEYGYTTSRADGTYHLAINAGGLNTFRFQRNGYSTISRNLSTDGQSFYTVETARMTRFDERVTTVSTNAPQAQVARSSEVSDSNGTRTATVVIPKETSAVIRFPSGGTQSVSSLNIRITEFTVGESGPEKMPAPLPPQTAYTYAVDLTADEAIALGADTVEFSKPIAFYVDNYLNIPTGIAVPHGYLNPKTGYWEPKNDGVVISVVGVENGYASLDLGSGSEATQSELSSFGIDPEEQQKIASIYSPGDSFWRIQAHHFSTRDLNFQGNNRDDKKEPPRPPDCKRKDKKCNVPGCEIDVLSQTMKETIDLPGTPYSLTYTTDKGGIRNASSSFRFQLVSDSPDYDLYSVVAKVTIAGKYYRYEFGPQPGTTLEFTWDGKDLAGRDWLGLAEAQIVLEYSYKNQYILSQFDPYNAQTFATYNRGISFSTSPALGLYTIFRRFQIPLRPPVDLATKLAIDEVGRWTFDQHHYFDTQTEEIYFGNGGSQQIDTIPKIVRTVAGTGDWDYGGDGGPAKNAKLKSPRSVTLDNSGNMIVTDLSNNRVRKINRLTGIITTIAGDGTAATSGDGGLAINASLHWPLDVAVDRDDNIYVSEWMGHVVRKIDKNGIISTIAGTGVEGYTGDGGPSHLSQLRNPEGIILHPDGSMYVSDAGNHVVRRIDTNGNISTIAGTGVDGDGQDGGLAINEPLSNPNFTALDSAGNLYIADAGTCKIRKVSPTGVLSTVAGTGTCGYNGDGKRALQTDISRINAIAVGPDDTIYFSDRNNHRVRTIDGGNYVSTIVGNGISTYNGDGHTGLDTSLKTPTDVAVLPDGTVLIVDLHSNKLLEWSLVRPIVSDITDAMEIPSTDGSEIYVFDQDGKHLLTRFAMTGAPKFVFEYDSQGLLVALEDSHGSRTLVDRDGGGRPIGITTPYGQRFDVSINSEGGLSSLSFPTGEAYTMAYNQDGLMSQFKKPKGNATNFTYDSFGYLVREDDAAGGYQILQHLGVGQVGRQTSGGTYLNTSTYADAHNNSFLIVQQGDWWQQSVTYAAGASTTTDSLYMQTSSFPRNDSRLGGFATFPSYHQTTYPDGSSDTVFSSRTYTENSRFDFTVNHQTQDPYGTTDTFYSSLDKTYWTTTAAGKLISKVINDKEQVTMIRLGNDHPVSYFYDSHGRISMMTQGDRVTDYFYDSSGFLNRIVDPRGRETNFVNDTSGRTVSATNPAWEKTEFVFDSNGNLEKLFLPTQVWHELNHNLVDLFAGYFSPGGANIYRWYDSDKNLTAEGRADGKSVAYSYDSTAFHRLSGVTTDDQSISITYHPSTNQVATVSTSDGSTLWYFYNGELATNKSYSGPFFMALNMEYSYYGAMPTSFSLGSSQIYYGYTADRELSHAAGMSLNRDSLTGRILSTEIQGIRDEWSYSQYGEMSTHRSLVNGSSVIWEQNVTRDLLGRIETNDLTTTGERNQYEYDDAGRLSRVTKTGATSSVVEYGFDSNGNRTSVTRDGATTNATYDTDDKLLTYGDLSFTYTPDGELKTKTDTSTGDISSYKYNQKNQLIQVALPSGKTIDYMIDGEGKRLAKLVDGQVQSYFVHDFQGRLTGELRPDGSLLSHFVYATQSHSPDIVIKNGYSYRLIKDHLGSIRRVVDISSGAVAQQISYDEFGVVLADSNPGFQPFGFAGGHYDHDTGLVRFGVRDYNSEIGRWMSKDPILFDGGDSNLYGYVFQGPINHVDPNGQGLLLGGVCSFLLGYRAKSAWDRYRALELQSQSLNKLILKIKSAITTELDEPCPNASRLTTLDDMLKLRNNEAASLSAQLAEAFSGLDYTEDAALCYGLTYFTPW